MFPSVSVATPENVMLCHFLNFDASGGETIETAGAYNGLTVIVIEAVPFCPSSSKTVSSIVCVPIDRVFLVNDDELLKNPSMLEVQ